MADELPIIGLLPAAVAGLLDQPAQEGRLLGTPVIGRQVDLLEVELFEHVRLAGDSGNEGRWLPNLPLSA